MSSLETLLLIVATFLLAGWVKGVVGMGLPTVAMGMLALAMPPVQAAALLVVPSLVTNVWQFLAGPAIGRIVRRLAIMLILVCMGTALGIRFLTSTASAWPSIALGTVLALYGLAGLFLPKFTVPSRFEPILSPLIGAATGVLTGATGVFVVPAVPYLSALGLSKDELIQALGLSFTVSSVALAVALGVSGSFSQNMLLASMASVVPALAGMFVGQSVRNRLDPTTFRHYFFIAMLIVGCYMAIRELWVSA
jgi:uncharacterized membrane protein YfcA